MESSGSATVGGTEGPESLEVEHLTRALEHLARQTGIPLDPLFARAAAARAIRANPGTDLSQRMEQLVASASECSMRVTPVRLPLSEVVWRARRDSPIVAVTREGEWLVMAQRGAFRVRVAGRGGDSGQEGTRREVVARWLGIPDSETPWDFAVVQAERPASGVGASPAAAAVGGGGGGGGGHGGHHGHHEHAHPKPHQRFFGLMRAEMPDIWSIILFSVISGVLYLAVPLTVDAVVNNIAFGGQQQVYAQALLILSVALLAFLGLLAFIRAVQHYLVEVVQRRIFVRLVSDLAYRLPRVTASAVDRMHAPELVNRFFDVITVQKSSSLLLLDGVNLVLSAVIGMVVLGFYHPFLLAFDLVLMALVVFVVVVMGRGAVRTSIGESVTKYAVASWLEALAHFPILFKIPGAAQFALDRADGLSRSYLDARKAHFRVLMRQICGLLAVQALASSTLLVVGGVLVLSGELTLGQLVASEIIVTAVVASVAKLGKHLEGWYDAMAAVDKLGYLVDLETERESGEVPGDRSKPATVQVRDLTFGYGDHRAVLSGVSFELNPGERAALVAPFGGGASTLLDLVHGFRVPDSGHVIVDGIDLRQWSMEALRRDVSLVRQHDVFEGTVLDNVRLGRIDIGLDDVREALAAVGLLDDVQALPSGLDTPLLFGGRPLTQIQRTRLILARAIVGRPRLLLLDEVLDGLDPAVLGSLADSLLGAGKPWTVLVATRDAAVRARCGRVICLDGTPHGESGTVGGGH